MRYLGAAFLGLVIALCAGVIVRFRWTYGARELAAPDRASVYASAIAYGINSAAFLSLLIVPATLVIAWWRRPRS